MRDLLDWLWSTITVVGLWLGLVGLWDHIFKLNFDIWNYVYVSIVMTTGMLLATAILQVHDYLRRKRSK